MKQILFTVLAALALRATTVLAYDSTPFAASGVGNGTAFSYAIIPASDYQKVQVQYINATSDKARFGTDLPGESVLWERRHRHHRHWCRSEHDHLPRAAWPSYQW